MTKIQSFLSWNTEDLQRETSVFENMSQDEFDHWLNSQVFELNTLIKKRQQVPLHSLKPYVENQPVQKSRFSPPSIDPYFILPKMMVFVGMLSAF